MVCRGPGPTKSDYQVMGPMLARPRAIRTASDRRATVADEGDAPKLDDVPPARQSQAVTR